MTQRSGDAGTERKGPALLVQRLHEVRDRIRIAASAAGRKDTEIELLPVTKTIPTDVLRQALALGLTRFGENRVQEARDKAVSLRGSAAVFDLIGSLQKNKAGPSAEIFDRIHSLESGPTTEVLNRRAGGLGRKIEVLIEMNTSGEASKHGFPDLEGLLPLSESLLGMEHLDFRGLMTMGPFPASEKGSRAAFAKLRETRDQLALRLGRSLPALSMGMSEDLEWAIMEGSTLLRVGRALFGERLLP